MVALATLLLLFLGLKGATLLLDASASLLLVGALGFTGATVEGSGWGCFAAAFGFDWATGVGDGTGRVERTNEEGDARGRGRSASMSCYLDVGGRTRRGDDSRGS